MCGIAGIHIKPSAKGKVPAGKLLDWLLLGIDSRGGDATGYLSVGFDNNLQVDKAPVKAPEFIKSRKPIRSMPQTVLAHTRLATQGAPENNLNNHPVQYGTVFLVHNGWITNDTELFAKHSLEATAEVDTLAIAAMLWEHTEGAGFLNGAPPALEECEGAMAIAAVDIRQPGELLLARGHNSPLVYIETENFWMWASTKAALKLAWGKVFGTPPGDKRFKELEEGKFILLKNGAPVFGEFKPAWGTRYTSSYNYWDDEYELTSYSGGSSSGGYWVTKADGTRQFRQLGSSGSTTMAAVNPAPYSTPVSRRTRPGTTGKPWKPFTSELAAAESFEDWALQDNEVHEAVIYCVANEVGMDEGLVRWLLFHCPPSVMNSDKRLVTVRDYLDDVYRDFYNAFLEAEYAKTEEAQTEEATVTVELDESDVQELTGETKDFDPVFACLECGYNEMEEDGYCADCMTWRKQQVSVA